MHKTIPAALAAVTLLAGAATTAATMTVPFNAAFGEKTAKLTSTDVETDANALFTRIDVDHSGDLDADEFAAAAVVLAELARLNRAVTVETETARQVAVPETVSRRMNQTERYAIDAVARRDFHAHATDGTMDRAAFTDWRLSEMQAADLNANGALEGHELSVFAARTARPSTPRG